MTTIWLAELETRNFSFQALGSSDTAARLALTKTLNIHAEQYGLNYTWFHDYRDDVTVTPIDVDQAGIRDRESVALTPT